MLSRRTPAQRTCTTKDAHSDGHVRVEEYKAASAHKEQARLSNPHHGIQGAVVTVGVLLRHIDDVSLVELRQVQVAVLQVLRCLLHERCDDAHAQLKTTSTKSQ